MGGFLEDELRNLNVKRVLLYGDPAREIVKYAASEKVDLIVLPTHGYGPFRRSVRRPDASVLGGRAFGLSRIPFNDLYFSG